MRKRTGEMYRVLAGQLWPSTRSEIPRASALRGPPRCCGAQRPILLFICALTAGLLLPAAAAYARGDACLVGPSAPLRATGIGDAAEVMAARAAVEARCQCAAFDGSTKETGRKAYDARCRP